MTTTTITSPISVQTIGTGQMENDRKSLFSFQPTPKNWQTKQHSTVSTTTAASSATESDDDDNEGGLVKIFDTSTDLAYHNPKEYHGCKEITAALTEDESAAVPDDFMPLRHYRAEKGDISKAITAIKSTLRWRKEFGVDKIVKAFEKNSNNDDEDDFASILRKENETGKIYVRGYDKDGRALMYMRPGAENTMNETNNMRHLCFQLEKAVACSNKNGHGKICLIIDYDGFTLSKAPPMSTSMRTLDMLQKHYCERMYRAYVCNPPFVFKSFWAVIKPFVDPVTKQKICFCSGKKGVAQIVDDMGGPNHAGHLESCAGGNCDVRSFDSTEYMSLPFNVAFDEIQQQQN